MHSPTFSTTTARAALDAGHSSATALTTSALDRIADPSGEGARAFTQVFAERTLRWAQASDTLRGAGLQRSPLEGLPVSVKDLFDVAGTTQARCSACWRRARSWLARPT